MKKSPLNSAWGAATSAAGGSGGSGSGNPVDLEQLAEGGILGAIGQVAQGVKTQSLRDTPNALMGDGSEAVTEHETIYKHIKKDVNPSFETAVQGDIMQSTGSVTQSAHEKPLGDVFEPGARVAAENMFGATVPGNFGRSMGG